MDRIRGDKADKRRHARSLASSTGQTVVGDASASRHLQSTATPAPVRPVTPMNPRTEKELTHLEWHRILDAIMEPVGVITSDYRLVYANAAYSALLAHGNQDSTRHFCFHALSTLSHPSLEDSQETPCADCPLPTMMRTKQSGFLQYEGLLSPALPEPSADRGGAESRTRRVYQRWSYPVVAPDGTVDYVVEVVKDVTDQEETPQVAAHAEALCQTELLKAELLGTISHELRNPLAVIKGSAATLLRHGRQLEQEEQTEFLHAITGACDHLEVMVHQLLQMSQLETGALVPEFTLVDAGQLARDAVVALQYRLKAAGFHQHEVAMTPLREETLPLVQADPRLLRDALDSVLENALYYSPAGGTIQVSMQIVSRPSASTTSPSSLIISVQNSGIGILTEHLDRIFDRFHRVEAGLVRAFDGRGLGLAICKRILELHGGSVWGESQPGEGSTFYLSLPLSAPVDS